MSLSTLKKEQLKAVAEGFGLEVPENAKVDELKAAIAEADYITFDEALPILKNAGLWDEDDEEKHNVAKEEAVASKSRDTLVRMHRKNHTYELLGYRFTRDNPYALVTAEEAEYITESDPNGFRYATPKEAIEFYG